MVYIQRSAPFALTILLVSSAANGQTPFSDTFTKDSGLNPGWTLEQPNPSSFYTLNKKAGLLLDASAQNGGSDLWCYTNFDASLLLQPVNPNLNWTLTTRVSYSPTDVFQGAGFVLMQQVSGFTCSSLFHRFEFVDSVSTGEGFESITNGQVDQQRVTVNITSPYIRLTKDGTSYTWAYSGDGKTFTTISTVVDAAAYTYIGLDSDRDTKDGDTNVDTPALYKFFQAAVPSSFETLYTFTGDADGSSPNGGLIEDSAGLLYGTAYSGGVNGFGTVFNYNTVNGALTTLYAFTDKTDGAQPRDKLLLKPNGTLIYGATQYGGTANAGTVFEIDTANNELTTLYSFLDGADGATPGGNLQLDGSGNLDGEVSAGGAHNFGGVFQVNPNSETEKVLYSFPGAKNGSKPGLITLTSAGVIYGSTGEGGGAKNAGTIYALNATTKKKTTLYTFQDGLDGGSPNGGLVLDSSGNLYGTSREGGVNSFGTLFKLNVSTKQFTMLHAFTGKNDGSVPLGGLVLDNQGVLWGVTEKTNGVKGTGSLYTFDTGTNTFTTDYDFTGGADGGTPNQFLLIGNDGAIYGTTLAGGSTGFGTIYKFTP